VAQPPSDTTAPPAEDTTARFSVSIGNFDGPFDLLLSLIAKHEMDITEVSLSLVTGEFIAYLRELDTSAMSPTGTVSKELDQASEFLVVAATLLDLKVAAVPPP
jgi:segregation and condensation protein A